MKDLIYRNKMEKQTKIAQNFCLFPELEQEKISLWQQEMQTKPLRAYRSIELFAGAGGLALGLEKAGFHNVLLNEIDKYAAASLRLNRSAWHVVEQDIHQIDFSPYQQQIDLLSGGFPCQAFSLAGKQLGLEDIRGTLFYQFARAIQEIQPKIFLGENVKGLLLHQGGKTLNYMVDILKNLGYILIEPKVFKTMFYQVPQNRERLLLVGIRKDLFQADFFKWPAPFHRAMTMRDALKKGELFESDVPFSEGTNYAARKKEILALVPQGGYWRDLPLELQKEYMKKSYFLGGGKTGMARRLAWDQPSLTLTCAPAQNQTERCHPEETRPLTVREYARIQTFPDTWQFTGPIMQQYKQIGNAVPVHFAAAVGRSLIRLLNRLT
jgi:DNA (cytosine-5)-methyltransferase 1